MRIWSFPASFTLHVLLLLGFSWFLASKKHVAPLDEGMPVEIWTPEYFDVVQSESEPPSSSTPHAAVPVEAEPGSSEMKRAETIRSGEVLSHPHSRKMAAALASMEEETRWEQLCGIEAMAQIASIGSFQPDRVVAYAMADVTVGKGEILAEGAAFQSKERWYRLKFLCRLSPNRQAVETFDFSIGDAIPRRLWETHNLPPRY